MKKSVAVAFGLILFSVLSFFAITNVIAEQGGLSPDSGATSRIGTLSGLLTTSGYGSDTNTPNWGTMWNRIYTSAIWTPNTSNNAATEDVANGKKFYAGNNRTELTGTAAAAIDFTKLQFSGRDDFGGPNGSGAEDYQGEEATWTDATSGGQAVWKDTRTGTYWSADQGSKANNFTMSTCPFFTTYSDVPNYKKNYDGLSSNCGGTNDAINYCAKLTWGGRSDWYLPSQKELLQAYIDGMYNQAGTNLANASAFTTTNYFWSSSEVSYGSSYVWLVHLYRGCNLDGVKTTGYSVRCIARD
jgi:hypothetical protein